MADKTDKASKERPNIEPVPKNKDFFDWLEGLFYGPNECPQRIEVRAVSGRQFATVGVLIKKWIFTPSATRVSAEEEGKDGTKLPKPSKEEIVEISNLIISLTQRECDTIRRTTVYGVHAIHMMHDSDPYERWLIRCIPQGPKGAVVEDEDDDAAGDEDASPARKYQAQKLVHDERMFNMYAGALEGILDRYDLALKREGETNENLRRANERLLESNERLQSQEHQRRLDFQWQELKMDTVKKGIDMVTGVGPPILGKLLGKPNGSGIEPSAESFTLATFFKGQKEGGKMTLEMADKAFGMYDENGKELVPGILREEQGKILHGISECKVSPDELDKLLPGGALEVSMDQIVQLQQIFSPEHLMPIITLIGLRMSNKQAPAVAEKST